MSWVVYQGPSQLSGRPDFRDVSLAGTRRHHLKSRMGCTDCKQRRIKCDEAKPACKQCVDYGRQCSYLTKDVPNGGQGNESHHDHDVLVSVLFEQVWDKMQSVAKMCSLAELSTQKSVMRKLISHFICCKDEWLAAPITQQLLQQQGLQIGLQSDSMYLLHAILAVTACHLQYLEPSKPEFKLISDFNNLLSLQLYRRKLNNIQLEDAEAILMCGAIHNVMAINHVMLDAITVPEGAAAFESMLTGLKLITDFPTIRFPIRDVGYIDKQSHQPIFPVDNDTQRMNTDVNQEISRRTSQLSELEPHLRQLAGHSIFEDTYREPFEYLLLVGARKSRSSALDLLVSFPNRLSTSYLDALGSQASAALLLLGYWLHIFSAINQWWITDSAVIISESIHVHLRDVLPATVLGREALLEGLRVRDSTKFAASQASS